MRVGDDERGAAEGDHRRRLALDLGLGDQVQSLAEDATHHGPEAGGERYEREDHQSGEEPEGAQPLGHLAGHVVGLLHRDLAGQVLGDHDRAVQVGAAGQRGSVVVVGGVMGQVAADQDVGGLMVEGQGEDFEPGGGVHDEIPCAAWAWCATACTACSSLALRMGLDVEDDLLDGAGERERLSVGVAQVDHAAVVAADVHACVGGEPHRHRVVHPSATHRVRR